MSASRKTISIIVPAFNEEKVISACLESLLKQKFPKEKFEIIIVDNNSEDKTAEIIRQYPVKYVFEKRRNRSSARNAGIKAAQGELIAFTDADCIADPDWLGELVGKYYSGVNVAGVSGNIRVYDPKTRIEKYFNLIFSNLSRTLFSRRFLFPGIGTANALISLDALTGAGLFDEELDAGEDMDIAMRVCLNGYKFKYAPEAIVHHRYPSDIRGLIKRSFYAGKGLSLQIKKYRFIGALKPVIQLEKFIKPKVYGSSRIDVNAYSIVRKFAYFAGYAYGWSINIGDKKKPFIHTDYPSIDWRYIETDEILVHNSKNNSSYLLNRLGSEIWELFAEGKDKREIIEIISAKYQDPGNRILTDTHEYIDMLIKEGLLDT